MCPVVSLYDRHGLQDPSSVDRECGEDNPQLSRHWERLPWVCRTEEMRLLVNFFFFFKEINTLFFSDNQCFSAFRW